MTRALIFDADGMLTHGPRFSDTYSNEFGIPMTEMTPFFSGPFQRCLLGKADLKEELAKGWLERWQWKGSADDLLAYWFSVGDRVDEQVRDSIARLNEGGYMCVLATNQEKYRTKYLSTLCGFDELFDHVFSSATVGHKKPDAELFEVIMSTIAADFSSIEANEVMFWDDDEENVHGARTFGLDARQYTSTPHYLAAIRHLESRGVTS